MPSHSSSAFTRRAHLLTSSTSLALLLHTCSLSTPTARIHRVWIPFVSILALPIASRLRRRLGMEDDVSEGGMQHVESGTTTGADSPIASSKLDLGSPARAPSKSDASRDVGMGGHVCGEWIPLSAYGASLGLGLLSLVGSVGMGGNVSEVVCVLALAAPILQLLTSTPSTSGPITPNPSTLTLLAILTTTLYLTCLSPTLTTTANVPSATRPSSGFGSVWIGVALAAGVVGLRVGAGRWLSVRMEGGSGIAVGGTAGIHGCRGCEGRVIAIALGMLLLLTPLFTPIFLPSLQSIPMIILVGGSFGWSPTELILTPSRPTITAAVDEENPDAESSETILHQTAVTALILAVLYHGEQTYTVQAILFGLAVGTVHLFRSTLPATRGAPLAGDGKGYLESVNEDGPVGSRIKGGIYLAMACAPAVLWAVGRIDVFAMGRVGMVFDEVDTLEVRAGGWTREVDYELAISYYNEPRSSLSETIAHVRSSLPSGSTSRTTVYAKGPETVAVDARMEMEGLMREVGADAVIGLTNRGREGETYLQHIVRSYGSTHRPLARHTIFLQPHIAWDWVANPRLARLRPELGFVSFGPYLNATCFADGNERDSHGMSFGRIPQIYSAFNGDFCPPTGFAITWAGQFLVSRARILSTPRATYQNLLDYFDVPKPDDPNGYAAAHPKSWIWKEGWWNTQPSDPSHGHWLERSWPAIFHCSRPELAWDCGEGSGPECECVDE